MAQSAAQSVHRAAAQDAEPSTRLPVSRWWLIGHLASLLVAAGLIARAARGQWFYFDEWDFLVSRQEWNLLVPHNGHLSLFPQLATTLIKGVVGLHEYWPYLVLTVVVHLVLVHLLWRIMLRTGAHPLIATLGAFAFAVLAPGADNVLWAFQVGFIAPLATGAGAFLLVMRPVLRVRDLVAVILLLVVGLGCSGTALPVTGTLLLFLLVRHGWRRAAVVAAAVGIPYGVWFAAYSLGSQGTDHMRASSVNDLLVRVPEYVTHGVVDGLAKTVPFGMLAPALLTGLALWIVVDFARGGFRRITVIQYLVLAALAFGFLTAVARVQLGVESASTGRYVYVYAALLLPAAARCLTVLARGSRVALGVIAAVMIVVTGFNIGGFMREGRAQSELELSVRGAMSAAAALDDGSDAFASKRPSPIIAPPLLVSDVRDFMARGQFTPVEPSAVAELDARVNLLLTAVPEAQPPVPHECARPGEDHFVELDPDTMLVESPTAVTVRVRAFDDAIASRHTEVFLNPGVNRLAGLDNDIRLQLEVPAGGSLCAIETVP